MEQHQGNFRVRLNPAHYLVTSEPLALLDLILHSMKTISKLLSVLTSGRTSFHCLYNLPLSLKMAKNSPLYQTLMLAHKVNENKS